MVNWDWLISATILIVLGLGFWARITKQTIPEIVGGIIEMVRGTSEDSMDYASEVVSYE